MTVLTENNRDEAFILTEANGNLSREAIALAAGTYASGAVVAKINTATNYVLATKSAIDTAVAAGQKVELAIVCRRQVVPAGSNKKFAAIVREAEVSSAELSFGASTVLADVKSLLEAKFVVARAAV